MVTRQLYASVTASIAGSVYFDMPANARIRAIMWAISCAAPTSGDNVQAELSLSSSAQTGTNDAQGILSIAAAAMSFTTSGACNTMVNKQDLCDYAIQRGQRIYLNVTETGSGTWIVRCLVSFD